MLKIGAGTMIDMGAILGGRCYRWEEQPRWRRCGWQVIGQLVLSVRVGDECSHQTNAVVIERCPKSVDSSVVFTGAIVTQISENVVVTAFPARIIKEIDAQTNKKQRGCASYCCNCKK